MQVVFGLIDHVKIVKVQINPVLDYFIDEDHTVVINLDTVIHKDYTHIKMEEMDTMLESKVAIRLNADFVN